MEARLLAFAARMMRICWCSLTISALLVVLMVAFTMMHGELRPAVLASLPPLALWSLVAAGYSAYSLYRLKQEQYGEEKKNGDG